MRRLLFTTAILAGVLCSNLPVAAHHSSAWFDMSKETTVTGQITRVAWTNPHILVYVEGNLATHGKETFVLEGLPPNGATRTGVTKERLQAGMAITARVYLPRASLFVDDRQTVLQGTSTPASVRIVEAGEIRLENGETMILGRGPGFKGIP